MSVETPTQMRGVYPYVATPFDESGNVSETGMRRIVGRVMEASVHGIVPLGSSGELPYLSVEDRARVIEICVDEVAGRVPVVPGVFGFSTTEAVRQAVRAQELGTDGILVVLNAYTRLSDEEIVGYFEAVADAVDLPIVVYHHPGLCRVPISVDLALRLGEIPSVVAIKDASGSLDLFAASPVLAEVGVSVFAATAISPTCAMLLGAVGWMSGPACVMPAETVAMYDLCRQGRWDVSLAVERQMQPMLEIFRKHGPGASVKAMLNADGFDAGPPAQPIAMPAIEGLDSMLADVREGISRVLAVEE